MPTEVPYAADAEISLTYDELEVCSHISRANSKLTLSQVLKLQYQKELAQDHVTVQSKFNYAWGLVKSPVHDHQVQGVKLLQGTYGNRYLSWTLRSSIFHMVEIYRAEPTRRRECLYYLALGHYKMSNFEEAKKFNGTFLRFDRRHASGLMILLHSQSS
jgi:hypothetical protein